MLLLLAAISAGDHCNHMSVVRLLDLFLLGSCASSKTKVCGRWSLVDLQLISVAKAV